MNKIISYVLLFLICFSFANPVFSKEVKKKDFYEIREIQTRILDCGDKTLVSKAVINTLQDNGFIIQNIEPDLGYIRAKKEVKLKRTKKGRVTLYSTYVGLDAASIAISFGTNAFAMLDMYQNSMRIKNEVAPHTVIFDSNVVIEPFGKSTKVRFNVIEKELENSDGYTTVKSSPRKVVRHYEQNMYQEFFNQVSRNIFIEKI